MISFSSNAVPNFSSVWFMSLRRSRDSRVMYIIEIIDILHFVPLCQSMDLVRPDLQRCINMEWILPQISFFLSLKWKECEFHFKFIQMSIEEEYITIIYILTSNFLYFKFLLDLRNKWKQFIISKEIKGEKIKICRESMIVWICESRSPCPIYLGREIMTIDPVKELYLYLCEDHTSWNRE